MYATNLRIQKRGPLAPTHAEQGATKRTLRVLNYNRRASRRRDGRTVAPVGVPLLLAASVLSVGVMSSCASAGTPATNEHAVAPQSQDPRVQMMAQLDAQQRNLDALRARVLAGDGESVTAQSGATEPVGKHLPTGPATVAPPPVKGTAASAATASGSPAGVPPAPSREPVATPGPASAMGQPSASPSVPPTLPVSPVTHDAAPAAATAEPGGTGNAAPAARQDAPVPVAPTHTLTTSTQRQAYASGVTVWRQIAASLDAQKAAGIELDPQLVLAGLQDMANGRSLLMSREAIDTVMTTLNQQFHERNEASRVQTESEGRAYRIAFSREKGAKSDAGAWYQVQEQGKGKRLRASDVVELSVTGSLPDGTTFDPSGQNGQTKTAKVSALLPAVAIGLQKVSVGGHIKVVVPPEKGYGDQGLPPSIPGGATLIFDIRVLRLAE